MTKIIDVSALQQAAIVYDSMLRVLPFSHLDETLKALSVRFLEVKHEHKLVQFQRKGGLAKPYALGGVNTVGGEIGKAIERNLKVEACYAALRDNAMNYRAIRLANADMPVDNKQKLLPQEAMIIANKVKSIAEDILDAAFFGERDTDDKSPMGMFDGFYTKLAKEVVSGEISEAKRNLKPTAEIVAPIDIDDTTPFDILVDFIRSAHPALRRNALLTLTQQTLFHAMDALGNRLKYKNALEYEVFVKHLQGITQCPRLQILADPILGTGSNLMLSVPLNLDFGMNTLGDERFVQIRTPYEDPNDCQFWMQWDAGTRVNSIHAKEFQMNDKTNSAESISGDDYVS